MRLTPLVRDGYSRTVRLPGDQVVGGVLCRHCSLMLIALVVAGCLSHPVPHLEREMNALEAEYEAARLVKDPVEQVRQVMSLQDPARRLRTRLDEERVLVPRAEAEGSSAQARGRGTLRIEMREVDKLRVRIDNLIRRVDGYLVNIAPARLEGTGYRLSGGRLVEI